MKGADMPAKKTSKTLKSDTPAPPQKQLGKEAGFYLVGTPLGNAGDITLRALEMLRRADVIFCEDTRVTSKLLSFYGIEGITLLPAHDHNENVAAQMIAQHVAKGELVIYCSDAGLPCISDPGVGIVQHLLGKGIRVQSLPGPNAALTALQVSGLPTDAFYFAGFLPNKTKARRDALQALSKIPATLLFYEAPHRVLDTLKDMQTVLGNRPCCVARELTKQYEELRRGSIESVHEILSQKESIKGELVIVVGAFLGEPEEAIDQAEIDKLLLKARETLSARDAAAIMSSQTGLPKRELYQRLLHLNDKKK